MEVGELRLEGSAGGFVQGTCRWPRGQGLTRCSCTEGGMGKGHGGLPLPMAVLPLGLELGSEPSTRALPLLVPVVKEEKSLVFPWAREV